MARATRGPTGGADTGSSPSFPEADRRLSTSAYDPCLIPDNHALHRTPATQNWLLRQSQFHLNVTRRRRG